MRVQIIYNVSMKAIPALVKVGVFMFNLSYKAQRLLILFGFLIIPVALLLTFSYYPAMSLFYFSFTDWSGVGWDMNWIGFENYKEINPSRDSWGIQG